MYKVTRYTPQHYQQWNRLVAQSRQATFLFDRRYMDYHADRFQDHSLIIYRKQQPFALLPGNVCNNTFYSHQGLTYGGLVTDNRATATHVCEAFNAINDYLRSTNVTTVHYKPVPYIYHLLPADEDLYALFLQCHATLVSRNVSSAIALQHPLKFAESRRSGLRKAIATGYTVRQSNDIGAFWQLLTSSLYQRHHAKPVHTAAEMELLRSHFPQAIQLFMVYDNSQPIAGSLLYITPQVVHTQYIATSEQGRQTGALDLLFQYLIFQHHFPQAYFDFGTSAADNLCHIAQQLFFQKQGFGARAVCYDQYQYQL